MNETPVLTEEPVRFPRAIEENAFFYFPKNEDFVRQQSTTVQVPNPVQINNQETIYILLGVLGILVVAALLSTLIPFPVTLCLLMIVLAVSQPTFIDYLGNQNSQAVAQKFLSAGTILKGKILSCVSSVGKGRDSRFFVEATYEYVNPSGERRVVSVKTERAELNGKQLPAPGTPIYILYFNDKEYYLL